jgi:hypothetical protein
VSYITFPQITSFLAWIVMAFCGFVVLDTITAWNRKKRKHEANMNIAFVLDQIEAEYENYLKMLRDGHWSYAHAQDLLNKGLGYVYQAALAKALAVFNCDDDTCSVDQYSSRVCERGTMGCTVGHAGASSYSPIGLPKTENVTIRKVWASGGSTGWCDYLMSDNSVRTLRVADIVAGQTFPPNDGTYQTVTLETPTINVIFQPPRARKAEPRAHLIYEGETFEIGYTLMNWMAGWVSMGASEYSGDVRIAANLKAALRHISMCMGWDANPPPEDEHTAMLRRMGHKVARSVYVCPHPEITMYEPGYPKE